MDTLIQDIRYAARKLLRTPGFTVIAVATLALAIGATTAVFSLVNGVLLKPLPYPQPEQLVRIGSTRTGAEADAAPAFMSFLDFRDLRAGSTSIAQMAAINTSTRNISGDGAQPLRLRAARVSVNFFDIFAVPMQQGRGFAANEAIDGADRVVVVSDGLWRSYFGADPRTVGRAITLDGEPYTVVGIAPAGFDYPSERDIWTPLAPQAWEEDPGNRGAHYLQGIGRLKPGATAAAAKRELETLAKALEVQFPESNTNFGATAEPLLEQMVGDVRPALFAMLGAVGFVLLIACANVANLLLVRAASRETELAVRTALGAARGRLVRQLVTESLLLSVAGAVVGSAIALWIVDAVVAFGPQGLPRLGEVTVDARVLGFTALVAIVTGLAFGLVPALVAARSETGQMLRESGRGTSHRAATNRTRALLVVAEFALAVVLLVGAGLLIRSFVRLVRVDPGFDVEHVVTFTASLPSGKYGYDRQQRAFADDVIERMKRLPGVQSAAVSFGRPLERSIIRTTFDVDGRPPNPPERRTTVDMRPATPDFFRTLGIPLVRGRLYTTDDRNGRPPVVVVNEEFVKRYFPTEDPVGKSVSFGWGRDTAENAPGITVAGEIIGVVGDIKQYGLDSDPFPTAFVPFHQHPVDHVSVLVLSTAEPRMVQASARAQMRELDADLPLFDMMTMEQALADSVAQPRFYMMLLAGFAGVALLLAALGIYGVISYTVSQRTRELGIRIALGATRQKVVGLVIARGLVLTAVGVTVGLVAAFWLTRILASLLFGIGALDVLTYATVAIVLVGVAALASWVPARRAARVDPVIAMRAE
jgi:predicted permease